MTSLKTSIKTITYLSDIGCLEIQGASLHWNALNEFCRDGWVEIDNNIGENALRSVAVGRKNYLFFGSDKGGESAAIIYSLLVTCKLNEVEPEDWLREVIVKLNDWPSNRVHELLPWNCSTVK